MIKHARMQSICHISDISHVSASVASVALAATRSVLRSQAMETPQPAPRPPRPSPKPSREPCWTCFCTKASQTFPRATFSGTSLNLTRRLHQCTPELFLNEDPVNLRCSWGISFGGIPNSRSVLFLQIFLKRAAKPSAGNPVVPIELDLALHQRFPKPSPGPSPKPSPELVEPDLDLHETPVEPLPGFLWNLLWNLVEPDLTLHQSRNLLRHLLRNPVDSDPALHQSLLDLLRNLPRNQVRFNKVPAKVPEKVPGGFGAEPGRVQQGSGERSG